jgi:hypothetical protein
VANDEILLTATSLFPDDAPATRGSNNILLTGTDFSPGLRAQFGTNPDLNGAGTDAGMTFESTQLGGMTVTP